MLNDRIRDLIRENPNLNAIRQEAVKNGMKYLQQDGLRQVIEGIALCRDMLTRYADVDERSVSTDERSLGALAWPAP